MQFSHCVDAFLNDFTFTMSELDILDFVVDLLYSLLSRCWRQAICSSVCLSVAKIQKRDFLK